MRGSHFACLCGGLVDMIWMELGDKVGNGRYHIWFALFDGLAGLVDWPFEAWLMKRSDDERMKYGW